ncbi:hypothetical protein [Chryseobacterium lactis]|uniref:hypothetical protein n=1 Tax=Chryseobacterium lactis TaxID=1241981 RepID=UPI0016237332|nr:hypothetical protein [Chryseobacterium lactis]
MKNKLRKIVINNLEYLYFVTVRFHAETGMNTTSVKVFLSGFKKTPLVIEFLTINDYYLGSRLNFGIMLMNKMNHVETEVNLNKPGLIRKLILQGQESGWSGTNTIEKQNGLIYLEELGFETNPLLS